MKAARVPARIIRQLKLRGGRRLSLLGSAVAYQIRPLGLALTTFVVQVFLLLVLLARLLTVGARTVAHGTQMQCETLALLTTQVRTRQAAVILAYSQLIPVRTSAHTRIIVMALEIALNLILLLPLPSLKRALLAKLTEAEVLIR